MMTGEYKMRNKIVLSLGMFLVLMQVLDGIFTIAGVLKWGIRAEGNPLIYNLMLNYDPVLVVVSVKVVASIIAIFLMKMAYISRTAIVSLFLASTFYFFVAIVPWAYVLFVRG